MVERSLGNQGATSTTVGLDSDGSTSNAVRSKRFLVLGAATGYSASDITPFLESLRKCGYQGRIVLYVSRRLIRSVRDNPLFDQIELIPTRQWIPYHWNLFEPSKLWLKRLFWSPQRKAMWQSIQVIQKMGRRYRWLNLLERRLAQYIFPPADGRFLRYLTYLENDTSDAVLLADVRDVVFQTDPFVALSGRGLQVGVESDSYTIGTEACNASWVRQYYDHSMLDRIRDCPVSCSGVVYADRMSMIEYLNVQANEILGMSASATARVRDAVNQATHNVIIWTKRIESSRILSNFTSPLATLNGYAISDLVFDENGLLVNSDGSAISIVHQYDRVSGLEDRLFPALGLR